MKRTFLAQVCALALLSAWALPAQAQVVGGTGGATLVMADGELHSAGTIFGEVEWQYQDDQGRLRGGLLGYTGISSEGGGEQVGGGYRFYWSRPGGSFLFVGLGGFVLGEDTPGVAELTAFGGGEVGMQIPGPNDGKVTGFVGLYPSLVGTDGIAVCRLGVRAALN